MVGMNRIMVDPRRWISKGCLEHVDEVANIYVACEGINDRMEREVRDWLPMFSCTDDGSVARRRGAECDAALEARRRMDDVDLDSLPTQRRGFDSSSRAWATTTLKTKQGKQGRSPCSTTESCMFGLGTTRMIGERATPTA